MFLHDAPHDARLRLVVEHAPDGILLTIPDGRIVAANPAACLLLQRSEEELRAIGRSGIVVVDEAAGRLLEERERKGAARGILTLRRKDGTTFLASVASTVFTGEDGARWTSTVFHDVTESERARRGLEILADAGLRLQSSLDLATTLALLTELVVPQLADVCTVDLVREGGVERVAVAHRDPARRDAFRDVRRRSIRSDATAGTDFVLRTGEPSCVFELTDEWLHQATAGREHFEAARALGVRSFVSVPLVARGIIIGALALMSDGGVPTFGQADLPLVRALADRAAVAIDNAHRHAEALESRRLRDQVLDIVAHDLRNPLNSIGLIAQALSRTMPSKELDTIREAVARADLLIHDLLLASKTDAGALPLELRPVLASVLVDETVSLHRPMAQAKGLTLRARVESSADGAAIVADRHRIVQLLGNLVANAIKFTPSGGAVDLLARIDDGRILFRVTDTGRGIAPDELPRIFDRYWQAAHSRHLGAGLGLAIARGIAVAHGGDIAVESALGKGTTFTVVLPASRAEPPG